jgi:hypothetical protein
MLIHFPKQTSEVKKRDYDNKWSVVGFIPDPNFVWSEYSRRRNVTYTPHRWVTLGIFNTKDEADKQRQNLYAKFRKTKDQHKAS